MGEIGSLSIPGACGMRLRRERCRAYAGVGRHRFAGCPSRLGFASGYIRGVAAGGIGGQPPHAGERRSVFVEIGPLGLPPLDGARPIYSVRLCRVELCVPAHRHELPSRSPRQAADVGRPRLLGPLHDVLRRGVRHTILLYPPQTVAGTVIVRKQIFRTPQNSRPGEGRLKGRITWLRKIGAAQWASPTGAN